MKRVLVSAHPNPCTHSLQFGITDWISTYFRAAETHVEYFFIASHFPYAFNDESRIFVMWPKLDASDVDYIRFALLHDATCTIRPPDRGGFANVVVEPLHRRGTDLVFRGQRAQQDGARSPRRWSSFIRRSSSIWGPSSLRR